MKKGSGSRSTTPPETWGIRREKRRVEDRRVTPRHRQGLGGFAVRSGAVRTGGSLHDTARDLGDSP